MIATIDETNRQGHLKDIDIKDVWIDYQMAIRRNQSELKYNDYRITGQSPLLFGPPNLRQNQNSPNIQFFNCEFKVPVHFIDNKECSTYIYFQNCKFANPVKFLRSIFKDHIQIYEGDFEGGILIAHCTFERLTFTAKANILEIHETNFNILSIYSQNLDDPCSISDLQINFRNVTGVIDIERIFLGTLTFRNTLNSKTEVQLRMTYIEKIAFQEFFNNGRLKLFQLIPIQDTKPIMLCESSNLGKAEFASIPFDKFHAVSFCDSSILECSFVNVTWGRMRENIRREKDKDRLHDYRDSYRQLKQSYSKQGDSINEGKFHALEMHAYLKYLTTNSSLRLKRETFSNLSTIIVLFFSRVTSNFGLSISRPLITISILCGILFSIMVSQNQIHGLVFDLNLSPERCFTTIASFLHFVNPIRRINALEVNKFLPLDILSRIIMSYSIYNFIRATRRFVK